MRAWVDAHPSELLVIWLSKHGNDCAVGDDAYPGVDTATKQAFWAQIAGDDGVFGGLLLDTASSSLNGTTYPELVARDHRIAMFASDFLEVRNDASHKDGLSEPRRVTNQPTVASDCRLPTADCLEFTGGDTTLATDGCGGMDNQLGFSSIGGEDLASMLSGCPGVVVVDEAAVGAAFSCLGGRKNVSLMWSKPIPSLHPSPSPSPNTNLNPGPNPNPAP